MVLRAAVFLARQTVTPMPYFLRRPLVRLLDDLAGDDRPKSFGLIV